VKENCDGAWRLRIADCGFDEEGVVLQSFLLIMPKDETPMMRAVLLLIRNPQSAIEESAIEESAIERLSLTILAR
jgi:hypothetical protein